MAAVANHCLFPEPWVRSVGIGDGAGRESPGLSPPPFLSSQHTPGSVVSIWHGWPQLVLPTAWWKRCILHVRQLRPRVGQGNWPKALPAVRRAAETQTGLWVWIEPALKPCALLTWQHFGESGQLTDTGIIN